jgi:hypothetical protein
MVDKNFKVCNQIYSQRTGAVRKVRGDHGIKPPALIGFIGKEGKGTVNRHADGKNKLGASPQLE